MNRFLAFGVLLALGWDAGCGHGECDCSSPGLYLIADGVGVASMVLSGPGCEDAMVFSTVPSPRGAPYVDRRDGFVPGGHSYYIRPVEAGNCTVTIGLDNGIVIERTVTFIYQGGACCAGYYTHDYSWRLSDWALDASAD
jgi:hypothetical protein